VPRPRVPRQILNVFLATQFKWTLCTRRRCRSNFLLRPCCHLDPTASAFLAHTVSALHSNYLRDRATAAEPYSARKINRALTKQIHPGSSSVRSLALRSFRTLARNSFSKKIEKTCKWRNETARAAHLSIWARQSLSSPYQERRTTSRCRARQLSDYAARILPPMAVIALLMVGLLGDGFMLYALVHWMRDGTQHRDQ
jgi:hypothetical protein